MASERASCDHNTRLEPTFIRMMAWDGTLVGPVSGLVIHVHPNARSTKAEVAVYTARVGGGGFQYISDSGVVYALPRRSADLEGFAKDLLSTSRLAGLGADLRLCLPEVWKSGAKCWKKICIGLYSPKDVAISATSGNRCSVLFPSLEDGFKAVAFVEVESEAAEYTTARSLPRATVAGGYLLMNQYDPPPGTYEDFKRLRDGDMQRLVEALVAVLRQALRYRGKLPPPQLRKRRRLDYDSVDDSDSGADEEELVE